MREETLRRFLLLSLSAAAAGGIFYLSFRYLLPWCLPFLLAALIASLLEPIVLRWQRTLHFRRGFSSLVLTLTLLFLLGGLLSLLWTTLLSQMSAMLSAAPVFFDALPEAAEGLLARLERSGALRSPWLESFLREQLLHAVSDADSLLRALSARAVSALAAAASALPGCLLAAATCVLAIFFTSASYPALRAALKRTLPPRYLAAFRRFRAGATNSLARWLRAQAALSCVTFFELLLAFLITLLDALPVFGTGTALLPWALFTLLFGFPPRAIVLLALHLCTLVTRNTLEPKLISAQAGLPPVASLFAMYLGYCTFGVAGMILFPFFLLLLSQVAGKHEGETT